MHIGVHHKWVVQGYLVALKAHMHERLDPDFSLENDISFVFADRKKL